MQRPAFLLTIAALMVTLLSPASAQDKRIALVIGNGDYRNVFSIKNPQNDAIDVGQALSRVGFSVTTLFNATQQDMQRSLVTFANKASVADVAVIFYSGHALQSDGVYWFLPVDGRANTLADIARTSISLPQVLDQADGARNLIAVFLDTARNDPFNEVTKRNLPSGIVKQSEDAANVLISYATGAGRTVADGEGRNSPFTTAFLKNIEEPGIELTRLMKQIREDVMRATANQQIPAFYMTATDDAYFVPPVVKTAVPPAPQPVVQQPVAPPASAPEKPAAVVQAPEKPAEVAPAPAAASTPETPAERAPAVGEPAKNLRDGQERHPND